MITRLTFSGETNPNEAPASSVTFTSHPDGLQVHSVIDHKDFYLDLNSKQTNMLIKLLGGKCIAY